MSHGPAVLRFSRDRRGYESIFLVQSRGGNRPPRVLYWYRTPPGIKVGRAPFDDEMRRRIEAQNPDVTFDWPHLVSTPVPPPTPDVERWRERRQVDRAEKAARAARRADLAGPFDEAPTEDGLAVAAEQSPTDTVDPDDTGSQKPAEIPLSGPADQSTRRRRRRRRRRGRSGAAGDGTGAPPSTGPGSPTSNE